MYVCAALPHPCVNVNIAPELQKINVMVPLKDLGSADPVTALPTLRSFMALLCASPKAGVFPAAF